MRGWCVDPDWIKASDTEKVHTEVSLLWENRKVVFTEIAGGNVLSKCPKERHSPPGTLNFIMFSGG